MERIAALRTSAASAIVAVLVFACSSPSPEGPPLDGMGDDAGNGGDDASQATGDDAGSCTPQQPIPGQDPSSLPNKCCMDQGGAGHCVPNGVVPSSEASHLASCPNNEGLCVPDEFIKGGSAYQPPSCTSSLNMGPGVCLSVCITDVAMYKNILKQDGCATGQLCAPCTNPLTMKSSGACDIGKNTGGGNNCQDSGAPPKDSGTGDTGNNQTCPHTGPPVIDPNTLPACYTGGGAHCVAANLVPPAEQSQLAQCPNNQGFCVPDTFIESGGQFIPKSCSSLDGAEGRCLHVAIPQVQAQMNQLPQDACQTYERCVPCYSPLDGTDTGACHLSCDPGPTKPKVLFQKCCNKNNADQGTCIPSSEVPQAEQKQLNQDVCNNQSDLCVPTEMLKPGFAGTPCTASNFFVGDYTGVCLSKCLNFGIGGIAISQGSCDDLHKCAPCTNPLTGQPTGAPGCPP